MHTEALNFVRESLGSVDVGDVTTSILEFGSRYINGSVKDLFDTESDITYWGIDISPGGYVDEVADAATYTYERAVQLIVCAEVLEHAENAKGIVLNAARNLKLSRERFASGPGYFIATMATENRPAHSARDGGHLYSGEYYKNISLEEMTAWLNEAGMRILEIRVRDKQDLYVFAELI